MVYEQRKSTGEHLLGQAVFLHYVSQHAGDGDNIISEIPTLCSQSFKEYMDRATLSLSAVLVKLTHSLDNQSAGN